MGQTIKDGVESQEDVGGEVQDDGGHHHAAHQEGCVRQAEAREEGGEDGLCFPEKKEKYWVDRIKYFCVRLTNILSGYFYPR